MAEPLDLLSLDVQCNSQQMLCREENMLLGCEYFILKQLKLRYQNEINETQKTFLEKKALHLGAISVCTGGFYSSI